MQESPLAVCMQRNPDRADSESLIIVLAAVMLVPYAWEMTTLP